MIKKIIREWFGMDGHIYSLFSDESIGHIDCWCFSKD